MQGILKTAKYRENFVARRGVALVAYRCRECNVHGILVLMISATGYAVVKEYYEILLNS